jgi:hypothetical protein
MNRKFLLVLPMFKGMVPPLYCANCKKLTLHLGYEGEPFHCVECGREHVFDYIDISLEFFGDQIKTTCTRCKRYLMHDYLGNGEIRCKSCGEVRKIS